MFVSYTLNTYNRLHLLKNLMRSFEECNEYKGEFEWVITDYGSSDGTVEYLKELAQKYDYVVPIFESEDEYIASLPDDRKPVNARKKAHAIFGLARNRARRASKAFSDKHGLFIEIADDHQFVRKGDWVTEALNVIRHNHAEAGPRISSIIFRGLSYGRLMKQNNERYPVATTTNQKTQYYVAKHKCYDDYHIQNSDVYKVVGDYMEVTTLEGNDLKEWQKGTDNINHYVDYLNRTKEFKMCKVFLKYPWAIDFPNPMHSQLNVEREGLIVPLLTLEDMRTSFGGKDMPVSSEQVVHLSQKLQELSQ